MKKIKKGDKLQIQCYKHDGRVHRCWDEAVVLDVKKDYIVFGNERTKVTESGGSIWRTKEPAIMYFFKDKWYNIIVQLKKTGITYYCNIASPFIIEEDTIKYIDYDLDLRIFPSGSFKILDKEEYKYHKRKMGYSKELDIAIRHGLSELIDNYKKGISMFDYRVNTKYEYEYQWIKKEEIL